MIKEMLEDGPGRVLLLLMIVCTVALIGGVFVAIEESKRWEVFSATHECKVISHMSGSTSTGVGFGVMPNGQMGTVMTINTTPEKIGYACNDGVTYWR